MQDVIHFSFYRKLFLHQIRYHTGKCLFRIQRSENLLCLLSAPNQSNHTNRLLFAESKRLICHAKRLHQKGTDEPGRARYQHGTPCKSLPVDFILCHDLS